MTTPALVFALLVPVFLDQPAPIPAADVLEAYRAKAAAVGRDPDAQVRLALWCEANHLEPERLKHLARAVLLAPEHGLARALLGKRKEGTAWVTAETAASGSALIAEYLARRSGTPVTAAGREELAAWCDRNQLPAQARAHWSEVTRLDPTSERAWRRLGFKKIAGTWISPEALNQRELEARDREFASKHWRPKIERWVGQLVGRSPEQSHAAERSLLEIADPRSVPELVRAFAPLPPERHRTLCLVLGQLDAQAASRALAGVAVFSSNAEARRVATEMLARRDAREFADALVASVAKPIRYHVQPLQGPGSPGTVLIEGDEQNYAKHYAVAPMTNTALRRRPAADEAMVYGDDGLPYAVKLPGPGLAQFGGYVSGISPGSSAFDPFASFSDPAPVRSLLTPNQQRNVRMARDATERLQAQQASDIAAIEATNARIEETNSRVLPILQTVTGFTQGADPVFWQRWWLNQNGLNAADKAAAKANDKDKDTQAEKPTLVEVVSARPDYIPYSCFGKGTLVLTSSGSRAIETIEAGDLVLSQNSTTGVIDYRPVLVAHHNPPSPTLLVTLSNGDEITTSPFHRFWVAARGWVMARDLAEGYVLRTLGGTTRVAAIDGGAEQLVFNLDVADTHTFFVGKAASLVHDQTIPRLRGEVPFDVAALAIGEDELGSKSSPRERDRAVSRSADALAREPVR